MAGPPMAPEAPGASSALKGGIIASPPPRIKVTFGTTIKARTLGYGSIGPPVVRRGEGGPRRPEEGGRAGGTPIISIQPGQVEGLTRIAIPALAIDRSSSLD